MVEQSQAAAKTSVFMYFAWAFMALTLGGVAFFRAWRLQAGIDNSIVYRLTNQQLSELENQEQFVFNGITVEPDGVMKLGARTFDPSVYVRKNEPRATIGNAGHRNFQLAFGMFHLAMFGLVVFFYFRRRKKIEIWSTVEGQKPLS